MHGLVEGFVMQMPIPSLPAGVIARATVHVPAVERWLWVLCGYDVSHSCALAIRVKWIAPYLGSERSQLLFIDQAWNQGFACPPGWRAMLEDTDMIVEVANVTGATGDAEFDAFHDIAVTRNGGPVTVNASLTALMIRVEAKFAEALDALIGGARRDLLEYARRRR
jgi:hypothetical protein